MKNTIPPFHLAIKFLYKCLGKTPSSRIKKKLQRFDVNDKNYIIKMDKTWRDVKTELLLELKIIDDAKSQIILKEIEILSEDILTKHEPMTLLLENIPDELGRSINKIINLLQTGRSINLNFDELWFLPDIKEGNIIYPIVKAVEEIERMMRQPKNKKYIEFETGCKRESFRRALRRWENGENLPTWKTMSELKIVPYKGKKSIKKLWSGLSEANKKLLISREQQKEDPMIDCWNETDAMQYLDIMAKNYGAINSEEMIIAIKIARMTTFAFKTLEKFLKNRDQTIMFINRIRSSYDLAKSFA